MKNVVIIEFKEFLSEHIVSDRTPSLLFFWNGLLDLIHTRGSHYALCDCTG